jgi:hypothetical protein
MSRSGFATLAGMRLHELRDSRDKIAFPALVVKNERWQGSFVARSHVHKQRRKQIQNFAVVLPSSNPVGVRTQGAHKQLLIRTITALHEMVLSHMLHELLRTFKFTMNVSAHETDIVDKLNVASILQ